LFIVTYTVIQKRKTPLFMVVTQLQMEVSLVGQKLVSSPEY